MKVIESTKEMLNLRKSADLQMADLGFVPTMGALHEGHLSLIKKAKSECSKVIVSIFVNPTQFNDPEDLKKYPRTLEQDLDKLSGVKTDFVFTPGVKDIYPEPDNRVFDFGNLDKVMEGKHRKGHFNGVAQVVSKLFEIIAPQKAYFGQKDFQQLAIIKKLTEMLSMDIDIIGCPIVREKNGLAMSSRNQRLSPENREKASLIHKVLIETIQKKDQMSPTELAIWGHNQLNANPALEVEYFSIVDEENLQEISSWKDHKGILLCTAVKINEVRLIDNMFFL